jgi:uncharacterized protein (DUF2062 family)
MMNRELRARWIFVLLLMLAWHETTLDAYIDPGTGSMVVQGIIAAVAGTAVMIRVYWARIRAFLSRRADGPR